MNTEENYSVLDNATLAGIFARIVDDIDVYDSHELEQYAVGQGRCDIDRYLISLVGNASRTKNLSMKYKQIVRTNFRKYLRNVLGLDGDEIIKTSERDAVEVQPQSAVKLSPVTDSAQDVTGAAYKAYLKRSVLNRGRPFPTYEKARQYIRRHITAHIGADNYNDDQRITMPVDDINRNYPNITALGYAIKKAA